MFEERLLKEIIKEAERIEEDSEYSAKGHFNAAADWQNIHYFIGFPMTISAAIAGAGLIQNNCFWGGIFAVIAAILGALQTFINPQEKAGLHKSAGANYLTLRNNTRFFKKIELLTMADIEASEKIKSLSQERCKLNELSPAIPDSAYNKAKKTIEAGQAIYHTDKKEEE